MDEERLELSRRKARAPKTRASAIPPLVHGSILQLLGSPVNLKFIFINLKEFLILFSVELIL